MEKTYQINDIEIVNRHHLDGRYIPSLLNAISSFSETKQEIKNFDIYISDENTELVRISFSPKQIPGKKTLGGRTESGYGMIYFADTNTGEIVKTAAPR